MSLSVSGDRQRVRRHGSALGALLLLVAGFSGCEQKKPEPAGPPPAMVKELEDSKKENAALKETLGQKTVLLNQVQEELDALAKAGDVVLKAKQELEGGVKSREQSAVLLENVTRAKKLLEERSKQIKALQARLKSSESELAQVMNLMSKLLLERAAEMEKLENEIATLRGEKKVVEGERDEARKQKEEEETKRKEAEQALDVAQVAIGTEEELRARGVLAVQKKGVFGMSKKISLAPFKPDLYAKISIDQDRELPLGKNVKTYECVTAHDVKLLVKDVRGDETFLKIEDPKAFWHDKILVIVVTRK